MKVLAYKWSELSPATISHIICMKLDFYSLNWKISNFFQWNVAGRRQTRVHTLCISPSIISAWMYLTASSERILGLTPHARAPDLGSHCLLTFFRLFYQFYKMGTFLNLTRRCMMQHLTWVCNVWQVRQTANLRIDPMKMICIQICPGLSPLTWIKLFGCCKAHLGLPVAFLLLQYSV